jgi:spore germination cell wall hydrolase CwlJ-like protein
MNNRSIEVVAKTIYGEARGEYHKENGGLPSLIAVANVIYNRYNMSGEKLIENVCIKPKQFSCWNNNDPNYKILQEDIPSDDPVYTLCLKTASEVTSGNWPDLTKGATHYYSTHMKSPPYWAKGLKPTIRIGHHLFFRAE